MKPGKICILVLVIPLMISCTIAASGPSSSQPAVSTTTTIAPTTTTTIESTTTTSTSTTIPTTTTTTTVSTPLQAPQNLAVTFSRETEITLSWDPVPGATSYRVYRAEAADGPFEPVRQVEIRYETDWALAYIHYQQAGSAWSDLPGRKMAAMAADSGWKHTVIDGTEDIEFVFNDLNDRWDNNGGQNYTITTEGVYQVTGNTLTLVSGWDHTAATFTDGGLEPMTDWFYRVKAINSGEESELSAIKSARTTWVPYFGPWLSLLKPADSYEQDIEPLDPATGVTIHYRTVASCTGRAEYRKNGTETAWTSVTSSEYDGFIHHVVLTGLTPATSYDYRVYSENNRPSQVFTFTTAPAGPSTFSYIVLGDMQDGGGYNDYSRRWEDVAAEIHDNQQDIDFLLMVGDMASDDYHDAWRIFFSKGRDLMAAKVTMPVIGNHDAENHSSESFKYYFNLKNQSVTSKSYYRFSWGNATFFALNSERPDQFSDDPADDGRQYDWINGHLSSITATDDTWVFAWWHKPPYDVANVHMAGQYAFRKVTRNFEEKVDWVFTGHEHLYMRFKPLRWDGIVAGSYGNGSDQGVGYLTVAPAGNEPRTAVTPDSLVDIYATTPEVGFTRVDIDGSEIDITTWFMGGLGKDGNITPARPETTPVSYDKGS